MVLKSNHSQLVSCKRLHSTITKMEFERAVHGFLYIFYFVGLTSFRPHVNLTTWQSKIIDIFPTIFYTLLIVVASGVSIYAQSYLSVFPEVVDTVVTYLLIGSECALNVSVIVQTLFFREQFKRLYRKYVALQKYIIFRMDCRMRFDEFQSAYGCLTLVVLIPFALTLCARKTIYSSAANLVLESGMMGLQFAPSLVHLHTIIHVNLLNFFYAFLTGWLKVQIPKFAQHTHESSREQQCMNITELRQLKFIHYKLWEISLHINQIFGWSNLAIIFRNYFEVAYSTLTVYWIYLYSSPNQSLWTLIRKYMNGSVLSIYENEQSKIHSLDLEREALS